MVVASAGVDHTALGVDGWRRPDGRSGRSPTPSARAVLALQLRLVDGVRLPEQAARGSIERGNRSSADAAGVFRIQGLAILGAGDRDEEAALVVSRRSGNALVGAIVDHHFPNKL